VWPFSSKQPKQKSPQPVVLQHPIAQSISESQYHQQITQQAQGLQNQYHLSQQQYHPSYYVQQSSSAGTILAQQHFGQGISGSIVPYYGMQQSQQMYLDPSLLINPEELKSYLKTKSLYQRAIFFNTMSAYINYPEKTFNEWEELLAKDAHAEGFNDEFNKLLKE
jgi:hypothetical protein